MDKIIDNLYLGNVVDILSVDKTNFAACLTIGKEFIFSDQLEITEDSKIHIPDLSKIGIQHKKLSLEDGTNNCICKILPEALEFIENNIDKGIFVHCYAGVSRSASVVFAYLLYKKMKPLEAFELLTSKRPKVLPYESFIREILDYFNLFNKDNFKELKSGLYHCNQINKIEIYDNF